MISLLLADDHTLVREGLKRLLQQTSDIVVQAEAKNGIEVLELLFRQAFDMLVLDLSMPGRDGIDLIHHIKAQRPALPILVLTMHGEEQYAVRAIKAGASGYLTKDCAADELLRAVRRVAVGGHYLSAPLAERLAFERHKFPQGSLHFALSERELSVFHYLVSGLSNHEIAEMLSVSEKTVSTYKTRIFMKMNMHSLADLVRCAIQHQLIELDAESTPANLPGTPRTGR